MCGICGIVDRGSGRSVDRTVLKRMVRLLNHRGPDELGIFIDDGAGFGHARLSIIDIDGGSQPMSNEDGSIWLVFNGEIYNYRELRSELEGHGHIFATSSDTEVIIHLYEQHGVNCLDYMNGQFAFALWDRTRRTVFAARDRFGIRPFYYSVIDGRLIFASEIKSLYACPEFTPRIDPVGLDQTFTFWNALAPRTVFDKIRQLPPAHYMVATRDDIRVDRYWRLSFPDDDEPVESDDETFYAGELHDRLVNSVKLRMRSDVPVAAYLSGGLDSSLTCSLVRQLTDTDLTTFSVRFDDDDFDETKHQQTMVEHLGTDHHSIVVGLREIASAFADVVWHAETPLLRTAPVPLHCLTGLVRSHGTKVVVTGEGADEMLAGYNIFKEAKIRRFWARHPDSKLRPALLARVYPYIQRQGANTIWQQFFRQGLDATDDPCYSHMLRWTNTTALKRFFSGDIKNENNGLDPIADFKATLDDEFLSWSHLSQAQHIETATFLAGYLLSSQGDRVAMSHSVEGRFPFLDHNVAEWCARIPPRLKLPGLREKQILKHVARDMLPETVARRPKQPYRAPGAACFFGKQAPEFVKDMLRDLIEITLPSLFEGVAHSSSHL